MRQIGTILILSLALFQGLHGQFLGGAGDGNAFAQEANPDPCPYFFGDSTSGATRFSLANPDSCGYFEGSFSDGFDMFNLVNPDSCGYFEGAFSDGFDMFNLANPDSCGFFEGTQDDGFALGYMQSPEPCPTFYGSARAGFALGYLQCTPLEVTATPLFGRMEGEDAYLWWHTYAELSNLGFSLLRSEDRQNWVEVAWMDGNGNSNAVRKYEHTDELKPMGISYYRWQQVDMDGSSNFSNTVALLREPTDGTAVLTAFPVPLHQGETLHLHFSSSSDAAVKISIVDMFGKVLLNETQFKSAEQLTRSYDSSLWSAGSYYLILDQEGQRFTRRFVVL